MKESLRRLMKEKGHYAPTPKCLDCNTMMKLLNVGNSMWNAVWTCKDCSDHSKFRIANKVFLLWNNELDAWEWALEEEKIDCCADECCGCGIYPCCPQQQETTEER